MPVDPEAALKAVVAAGRLGRLTPAAHPGERGRDSLRKSVWASTASVWWNLEAIGDHSSILPKHPSAPSRIAARAVTLSATTGNLIPLATPERACFVVMVENRLLVRRPGLYRRRFAGARPARPSRSSTHPCRGDALEDAIATGPPARATPWPPSPRSPPTAARWTGRRPAPRPRDSHRSAARGVGGARAILTCCALSPASRVLATFSMCRHRGGGGRSACSAKSTSAAICRSSIPGLANYGEGIQVRATRAVRVTGQTP